MAGSLGAEAARARPGGAGARGALPGPDTRRRPRSSQRRPPPPPRSRSPSAAGAEAAAGPGRANFLRGCGRRAPWVRAAGGGAGGAPTPRPPRGPTSLLGARRGQRGAPEAGGRAPGRCGGATAAGLARPDRPPRGECVRGVSGRGAARPSGEPCAPGGRNRPGTPPPSPPREGGAAPGSPSQVPDGRSRAGCQRPGTARPRASVPRSPQPNLATPWAALAPGERPGRACVCGGGGAGAAGAAGGAGGDARTGVETGAL